MNLLEWIAGLAAGLAATAMSELVSEEARARLDQVPYALLTVAIRRLPLEIRADVGDEWRAELRQILRGAQAYPLTRLIHGIRFALGLLWVAPQIGKHLVSVRERSTAESSQGDDVWHRQGRTLIYAPNGTRWPIWRSGAVLAVGVALAVWQDWRLGVTGALFIAVTTTWYARMVTTAIPPERRAAAARRRTRRRLCRLNRDGYICLHGRGVPESWDMIDHLIIGPAGVFVLSSQWWDRRLPVTTTITSSGAQLHYGPYSAQDALQRARLEAARVSEILGTARGMPIAVRPGMVVYGPRIFWRTVAVRGVDVFGPRRMRSWLHRDQPCLSAGTVQQLADAAARALPPQASGQDR